MTAMSRRFYQALAKEYKSVKPGPGPKLDADFAVWLRMVTSTTKVIAQGNPAFDKVRFLTACGVTEEYALTLQETGAL